MQSVRAYTPSVDWFRAKSNNTAVSIRRATIADALAIADLGRRMLPVAHPGALPAADMHLYLDQSFNLKQVRSELRDPGARFLLAEAGQQVAGMVRIGPAAAPTVSLGERPVELSRLYLNSAWIGKGVGSALMRRALIEAAGAGYDVCWLTVWTHNETAQDFYRRWGFARRGIVIYPIGQSEIAMYLMAYPLHPASAAVAPRTI